MSILQIERLSAGYGRRRVLEHIDLTVRAGEIVAVLGENGSGKTTLLRAVGGSIPTASGRISVGGTDLSTLDTRRRAALVATMAQEIAAEEGLTGMDRIEMGFYPAKGLFGRLTAEETAQIREMAHQFGVSHLLERDLAAMSAGERQMVLLLGAAVRHTPLLLLDEPTSALDFNRTEALFALLHRLAAQGRAIVVVLHDPTQALRHASKILRMDRGTAEVLDLAQPDYEHIERSLRVLYPNLRIHREPLFCYKED